MLSTRIARSVKEITNFIDEMEKIGVRIVILDKEFDFFLICWQPWTNSRERGRWRAHISGNAVNEKRRNISNKSTVWIQNRRKEISRN